MALLNPYLNFMGNTEEAFTFYKSVFGGEFAMLMRFKDSPEKDKVSAEEGEKLMHIALPIGKHNILMGTDVVASMRMPLQEGNNISISIGAESLNEAVHIFNGLAEGGKVAVPFSKQFWGDDFGMLTDKFGIQWQVSFNEKYGAATA